MTKTDLTKGSITKNLILFSLPMIAGNLMQQFYNVADTLIIGRALGKEALASAVGNSSVPLYFLSASTIVNIVLDLLFVMKLNLGVKGAAVATAISQYLSGIGIALYCVIKCKELLLNCDKA